MSGKLQWVNKILLILSLLALISCSKLDKTSNSDNKKTEFENGDLIYRHGNGFFSNYFKNRSNIEQIYSHGGIVYANGDSIYVIHSDASEFTGIGGVKMEPISIFLDNIQTWGVYRLDTTQVVRDSIVTNAIKYVETNTPFDFDFDNDSDEKLYCTELIAVAVNKAVDRKLINPKNTFAGKSYYSVDDTYLIPLIKTIELHSK